MLKRYQLCQTLPCRTISDLIVVLREHDEALPWEIARQVRSLREAGVPTLLLTRQSWDVAEGAVRQVNEFMNGLKVAR